MKQSHRALALMAASEGKGKEGPAHVPSPGTSYPREGGWENAMGKETPLDPKWHQDWINNATSRARINIHSLRADVTYMRGLRDYRRCEQGTQAGSV